MDDIQTTSIISAQMTLEIAKKPVMGPDGMEDSETVFRIMKMRNSQPGPLTIKRHERYPDIDSNWTKVIRTGSPDRFDMTLHFDDAMVVEPDSPFIMIWEAILEHQDANPTHGYGCSCMDAHIRTVREWLQMWKEKYIHELPKREQGAARQFDRIVAIASRRF